MPARRLPIPLRSGRSGLRGVTTSGNRGQYRSRIDRLGALPGGLTAEGALAMIDTRILRTGVMLPATIAALLLNGGADADSPGAGAPAAHVTGERLAKATRE